MMKPVRRDRPSQFHAIRSVRRTRRGAEAVAIAATTPVVSSRTLDFFSLTLCSCALALLCHSAANPPQAASGSDTQTTQTRPVQSNRASIQPYTLPSSRPSLKAKGDKGE